MFDVALRVVCALWATMFGWFRRPTSDRCLLVAKIEQIRTILNTVGLR